jgi:hypothetical protein
MGDKSIKKDKNKKKPKKATAAPAIISSIVKKTEE